MTRSLTRSLGLGALAVLSGVACSAVEADEGTNADSAAGALRACKTDADCLIDDQTLAVCEANACRIRERLQDTAPGAKAPQRYGQFMGQVFGEGVRIDRGKPIPVPALEPTRAGWGHQAR